MSDDDPLEPDERDSGMHLEITLSIGYRRRRAGALDKWEARITTASLLAVGGLVVVFVVLVLIPRILGNL